MVLSSFFSSLHFKNVFTPLPFFESHNTQEPYVIYLLVQFGSTQTKSEKTINCKQSLKLFLATHFQQGFNGRSHVKSHTIICKQHEISCCFRGPTNKDTKGIRALRFDSSFLNETGVKSDLMNKPCCTKQGQLRI